MKKILLVTGLFLSIGLMASAQKSKTNATVQTTSQAPVSKQEKNKQQLVSHPATATTATTAATAQQAKMAKKNAILKARENSNTTKRSYKRPAVDAKTKGN